MGGSRGLSAASWSVIGRGSRNHAPQTKKREVQTPRARTLAQNHKDGVVRKFCGGKISSVYITNRSSQKDAQLPRSSQPALCKGQGLKLPGRRERLGLGLPHRGQLACANNTEGRRGRAALCGFFGSSGEAVCARRLRRRMERALRV